MGYIEAFGELIVDWNVGDGVKGELDTSQTLY